MLGARSVPVLLTASLLALNACMTIAPASETGVPGASADASASLAVPLSSETPSSSFVLPSSDVPSSGPATLTPATDDPANDPTDEPSTEPTDEPAATMRPRKTRPPEPSGPNLVITRLSLDPERPVAGEGVDVELTLKNNGDALAAGTIALIFGLSSVDGGALSVGRFENAHDLAAGDTATVTAAFPAPETVGSYLVEAIADSDHTVDESDEDDNKKSAPFEVVAPPDLGNLTFVPNSFTVTPAAVAGRYIFAWTLKNTGTANLVGPINVQYFGYTPVLDRVEWGSFASSFDLAPGDTYARDSEIAVEPGTYRAYALADHVDVFDELDETDNTAYTDFTAP